MEARRSKLLSESNIDNSITDDSRLELLGTLGEITIFFIEVWHYLFAMCLSANIYTSLYPESGV